MSQDAKFKAAREWLHGSLSGELESHPGKKLFDHLDGTAHLAREIADFYGLSDVWEDVGCASLTHDLGKADREFQLYLHGKSKGVEHSRPSSYFTLSLFQESEDPFEALFSAEAVRRHHTHIENWNDIRLFWESSYNKSFKKICENARRLLPEWQRPLDSGFFVDFLDALDDRLPKKHPFSEYWLRLRTVLSLLVAGDRLDAVNVREMDFKPLPDFLPCNFEKKDDRLSERRQEMNKWRSNVAGQCFELVKKIDKPGLFTLTLPTGAGKTNIGLKAAHILAENLGCSTIIYALPFISIVEQNADFAKKVFPPDQVQEDHSLMLASETEDEERGKNLYERDAWRRAMRLFRYWGAPVVVTTMVQLWNALLNPKAGETIDFHRLRNAVVLMDEPQSIDSSLWKGLGKLLTFLHEQWKTVFILMTATQPKIYSGVELAPPLQFPFNRHRYRFIDEKHSLDDISALLEEHIPGFLNQSGMMVFNTRMAARRAYDLLCPVLSDAPVFMLSRWMTPQHRREVIRAIKDLEEKNKRRYLIATQVVEAGVDLDFDWVFRDLAPLDSVVQVAGRCNRNAEHEEPGMVVITELQNEEGQKYSGIYDSVLVDATRRLLKESPDFDEGDVSALVAKYYDSLVNNYKSEPVWERIIEGEWGEYTPLFKDNSFDVPVYVDRDGKLDDILNKLMTIDKSLENRDYLKKLNNQLQQYMIGVSEKRLREWRDHTPVLIGAEQEMFEMAGDKYYVIRADGIGEEKGKMYHPAAGFSPFENKTLEDW